MHRRGQLEPATFSILREAYEAFVRVFQVPIRRAALLHGDCNTWNLMLDAQRTTAVAVIDPFDCCWGDPEYGI